MGKITSILLWIRMKQKYYLRNANDTNIFVKFPLQVLTFDDYKFEKCKKHCSNLMVQGKSKIFDFYAFLKSVEKFRSEKFKEVLANRYDVLLNTNSKSPYEVQLFFEDQVLVISFKFLN